MCARLLGKVEFFKVINRLSGDYAKEKGVKDSSKIWGLHFTCWGSGLRSGRQAVGGFSPSTEEWIKKMWHIHSMEYYSAIKNNKIMPFAAAWTDLGLP